MTAAGAIAPQRRSAMKRRVVLTNPTFVYYTVAFRNRQGNRHVMDNSTIVIRGAREHNLRNVDLDLPRNRLIVFTGVSGSGKSSLAFDTLYAEGQRRYVESLSSY